MIIQEIHIDGFGIFSGFSLTSLGKGVNIIGGNNEAGKSTLLKFLRYTLFGYPRFLDQRMAPLRGGNHGGRIKALLSAGGEVVFERHGNDRILLQHAGQESQDPSRWMQLLGNTSSALYNNIYAFSLDELVDLASLSASGVEDRIFSLGLGLGNVSLADVERGLQSVMDDIYMARGRVQVVPRLLSEMKEKRSGILRIQDNLPAYEELSDRKKALKKQIEDAERELEGLVREKALAEHHLRCHDAYIALSQAEEALEALPPLQDWPEQAVGDMGKLEEREHDTLVAIEELKQGTAGERGIAGLESAIEGLAFDAALLEREAAVTYLRDNLSRYLQTLDECGTEERQLEELQRLVELEIAGFGGRWTEGRVSGFSGQALCRDRIERFRADREALARNRVALETELQNSRAAQRVIHAKRLTVIIAVALFLGSVPAFYYGIHVLGGALAAVALLVFLMRRYLVREESVAALNIRMEEQKEAEEGLQQAYSDFLVKELALPGELRPENALETLQKVGQVSKDIAARDRLREKLDRQRRPFIREFEQVLSGFGNGSGVMPAAGNAEIAVNRIVAAYDSSLGRSRNKAALQEELARKRAALQRLEGRLQQTRQEISGLLKTVGADTREAFRKKVGDNEKVRALLARRNAAIESIEQIAGKGRHPEVITYLGMHEKQSIELQVSKHTAQIAALTESLREMTRRSGELNSELSRMEGGSDLAGLMTDLETARQGLRQACSDWVTAALALDIMKEVRARYERDKQPEVIRRATAHFRKITDDAYQRIRVSLDDHALSVYDDREASKSIGQLSRGTREQLLISLRLGFIEEYEKQSEPLPVIIDEVLVNFDPLRARQTAAILTEFATDRQVLVFTCRPETASYFADDGIRIVNL